MSNLLSGHSVPSKYPVIVGLLALIIGTSLYFAPHTLAAFSFEHKQAGSVNPSVGSPAYSLSSGLGFYELFGQFGFFSTAQICAAAAQKQGYSEADSYTCEYSSHTATTDTCVNGLGNGQNGGSYSGTGTNCSSQTWSNATVALYSGDPLPLTSQCAIQNGPVQGAIYPTTISASSCEVLVHKPNNIPTVPTATLTATPATVVEGNSSALTYSCSNSSTAAVIDNGVGAVSPVSAGTVSVTPTTSTTYTLTCTNAAGTDTATAAVTVTPAPIIPTLSDLTAGTITPTTAQAGQPTTLSASALNAGAGASGSFPLLFQISETSTLRNSSYLADLAPGASQSATVAYTFPSVGTYQVRACANYNTSWAAIVSESDYANNCGPWTTITVSAVPSPTPTCTLSASPTASVPSTLTWSATNATSCTGGGFSTGGATSGTATVNTAGAYTLSCTGTGGSCPTQSISVGAGACTAATGTITASPNRIKAGQSATLSYSATGITGSCTVLGPGVSTTLPAASCTVPAGTLSTGALSTQSLYILTCDGVERARTVVNVVPTIIEF